MLAPLRFGSLLRGTARHAGARSLADRSCRALAARVAALSRRHADPRDRFRDDRRRRAPDRFHARAERVLRPRAHRLRTSRPRSHAHGARPALQLRRVGAVGQSPSRWQPARDRGPRDDCAANAGAAARRRTDHDVALHDRGGGSDAVRAHLCAVASAGSPADRRRSDADGHAEVLAQMVRPVLVRRRIFRRRAALAHHAQVAYVRADGRHRCRRDHVASGAAGRRPQLGLPLLLAARRDGDAARTDERALLRRSRCVAALAAAGGRRQSRAGADHVRPCGRAAAGRVDRGLVTRLRPFPSGAHRQRRCRAIPARRLRRGYRHVASRASRRPRFRCGDMGHPAQDARAPGDGVGANPIRDYGRSAAGAVISRIRR